MAEFSVPPVIELPVTETLATLPERKSNEYPNRAVYALRTETGWTDVTAREFHEQVQATARGLVARGIRAGDAVALLAPTSYEWTVLDFALWSVGAFAVPIYDSSSAEQIQWIVADSGSAAVIAANPKLGGNVADALAGTAASSLPLWLISEDLLTELARDGQSVPADVVAARTAAVTPADTATIVYTSGTTGRPKGCVLTHSALVFVIRTLVASTQQVVNEPGARTVMFLPLAHVLGRGANLYCAQGGMKVAHCSNVKSLPDDMASFHPTFLVGVPRIFEKVYAGSQRKAHAAGKGRIFDHAANVAIAYGRAGGKASPWLRLQHLLFDRLVYSKIREAMGGSLAFAITGGASLGERLGHFFAGIGVTVMEGYGMTETTASGTFNRADAALIGSVGQPMPGTAVRIAEDGEIWLRGPYTMSGYHQNPEATAEILDPDGWVRTGDLGKLDADGFLTITGRKKEILVTAGGKNVVPTILEDRIQSSVLISNAVVVGEARPFIGALITLDPEALAAWAAARRKSGTTVAQLRNDPDLLAEIQAVVDSANQAVSRAESVRAWRLLDMQFTEEAGFITPSQKLKRGVVTRELAAEIDALYSGGGQTG